MWWIRLRRSLRHALFVDGNLIDRWDECDGRVFDRFTHVVERSFSPFTSALVIFLGQALDISIDIYIQLGSPVVIRTRSSFKLSDTKIFTSDLLRTSMGACRSQKWMEADKRIEKALNELLNGQFQSIREAARANAVSYFTLLQRMDSEKSTVESCEAKQIITIPEKNALSACITRLAILRYLPKHVFV